MKQTTSHAMTLTLFMLLLVLLAGFFFLFREKVLPLEVQLKEANQRQTETELKLSSSDAERTTDSDARAMAESDKVLLEGQLVDADREREALQTQLDTATVQLDSANAMAEQFQTQEPLVSIVSPLGGAIVNEGQQVNIIVTIADAVGIQSIKITIGEDSFEFDGEGKQTFVLREAWIPPESGEFTLGVTAVNLNNVKNTAVTRTITVTEKATAVPPTPAPPSDG